MGEFRVALVLVASIILTSCVIAPHSRTTAESTAPVTLNGYAASAGATVTLQAIDQNTGNPVTLGSVPASATGTTFTTSGGSHYTLYPWSYPAGALAPNYWSPQTIVPDLATAQGHLEITAASGTAPLRTFSQEAFDALAASSLDPVTAGAQFSDGTTTVLFDQTGVGSSAEGPWTKVAGMISDSHSPYYSPVAWSVGYYTVEGGKKIYAIICAPTTGGPYPVVIYNHGGTNASNGGNISGNVTAAGWTSQPPAPDGLGQCIDWAKRGWIFAASSYRGENVHITSASPSFAANTWTSDGAVEFCMGEVTDVLALTDLLVHHAGSITVGSLATPVAINSNGKLLMYGYSHGGCITHRAVEQGAPVTAYSVIEGFTDIRLAYLIGLGAGLTQAQAELGSGAWQPGVVGSLYPPDAAHVMGYNWRSAHYFAAQGDLAIRRFQNMPILILQGDIDTANPVPLAEPAEIAADIGATNVFVGPSGFTPPASEPCISGPVGAPVDTLSAPNATCPISWVPMNTGDACVTGASVPLGMPLCTVVMLPLTPPPGQPQQHHYLVVWHNMNHTNGGLAIKETFNRFAEQNFMRQPGCDGLEIDCASD